MRSFESTRPLLLALLLAPVGCVTSVVDDALPDAPAPTPVSQEASSKALVVLASQIKGSQDDPSTFYVLIADRPHVCSEAFDSAPNCDQGTRWQVEVDVAPAQQTLDTAVPLKASGVTTTYVVSETNGGCGAGGGCIEKGTLKFLNIGAKTVDVSLEGVPQEAGVFFNPNGQYSALRCE